jgi:dienelactone hydrolase
MNSVMSGFETLNNVDIFGEEGTCMKGYTEELAYVERQDGLTLEGAVVRPAGTEEKRVAVLWVHGNTSRFYDQPYLQIGREMAQAGYAFFTINTHGHDVTSVIWGPKGEAVPGGACWERFDEVPQDIEAWIDLAEQMGYEGVVLVGHSFGANKVVYYQAEKQDPRVLAVVVASGDVKWKATPDRLALAEQMEAEGKADEVLPYVEVPWYSMSARTFLGRARIAQHVFSSESQVPYIAQVRCPVLAFYGTEEEWCGTADDLEMIKRNASASERVETRLLGGADHVYWGQADRAAAMIAEWVDDVANVSRTEPAGSVR